VHRFDLENLMAIENSTTTTVNRCSTSASLGLLLARIPLGAYFIVASVGKLHMGIDKFAQAHLPDAPKYLPEDLARRYLTALPWVELSVGILVIIGLLTRVSAGVMTLLLISFMMALGVTMPGLPFHPNLVFLGTALAIMLCGPGWMSLDGLIFRPRRRVRLEEEIDRGAEAI